MRRTGRTTFVHHQRVTGLENGLDLKQLPYIDLEDERLAGIDANHLFALLEEYYRRYPRYRGDEKVLWCFDGMPSVPGWERFLQKMVEIENVDIFFTDSSNSLLAREIACGHGGHVVKRKVLPIGFAEVVINRIEQIPDDLSTIVTTDRSLVEHCFIDYLECGGLPGVQTLETHDRLQALKDTVDIILLRDIVERHGVSNIIGLRRMVGYLLRNPGTPISVERFYESFKAQGIAISKDTIRKLWFCLEDCFLLRTVWFESESEHRRQVNPRRAYPIDPGLIRLFAGSDGMSIERILETVVFLELERRGATITYVRTEEGYLVDFLARYPDGTAQLIQVCADISRSATLILASRALLYAGRHYQVAEKILLTMYRQAPPTTMTKEIKVLPAYEWILQGSKPLETM